MSTSRVLGGIFVALAVLELVGLVALEGVGADPSAARSVAVAALSMAWIFGVWAALVAFMIFIIAWVAEGMATDDDQADVRVPSLIADHQAVDRRTGSAQLLSKAS